MDAKGSRPVPQNRQNRSFSVGGCVGKTQRVPDQLMNALSPPKKGGRPAKTAFRKLRLRGAYHATAFLANTLSTPFWFFEQWRGRLADQLENEGFWP
jgi:hypothetical protein